MILIGPALKEEQFRTDRKRRIEGFNYMKNTSKMSSFRPKAPRRERTLIRRGGSSLEIVFIRTDRTIQYNKVSLGLATLDQ
jgi:hypothetical protein